MQKSSIISYCFMAAVLALPGCSGKKSGKEPRVGADISPALHSLNEHDLLGHIRILASDQFEGRAPGTRGEQLTVQYLTDQFRKLGLKPGNPDGTYVQRVPLSAFRGETQASF